MTAETALVINIAKTLMDQKRFREAARFLEDLPPVASGADRAYVNRELGRAYIGTNQIHRRYHWMSLDVESHKRLYYFFKIRYRKRPQGAWETPSESGHSVETQRLCLMLRATTIRWVEMTLAIKV